MPNADPLYSRKCDIAFELFKIVEKDRRFARRGVPEYQHPRPSLRNARERLEAELAAINRLLPAQMN